MSQICKTVEVTVPEIEEMRLAHYVTIGSECTTSLGPHLAKLYVAIISSVWLDPVMDIYAYWCDTVPDSRNFAQIGWDARIGLRVYGSFDSKEYLNAQRIR